MRHFAILLATATFAMADPRLGVSALDGVGDSHRAAVERWARFLERKPGEIDHIQDQIFANDWTELSTAGVAFLNRRENWGGRDEAFKARFELGIPMFPGNYAADDDAKWDAALRGEFDAHFRTLATNLVAAGFGRAKLRLAWEFNGTGGQFPWHIQLGDAARQQALAKKFASFWQRIHGLMRVRGADFTWVWCPMVSECGGYDPAIAWPGDAFVDVVSVDLYDAHGEYYWADPAQIARGEDAFLALSPEEKARRRQLCWDKWVRGIDTDLATGEKRGDGTYRGMEHWLKFAQRHGKKFAISEWALWPRYVRPDDGGEPVFCGQFGYAAGRNDLDNADFIERMHAWISAHDVAWASYFDVRVAAEKIDHSLTPRRVGGETLFQHPRSSEAYRRLFGRTGFPARK